LLMEQYLTGTVSNERRLNRILEADLMDPYEPEPENPAPQP